MDDVHKQFNISLKSNMERKKDDAIPMEFGKKQFTDVLYTVMGDASITQPDSI